MSTLRKQLIQQMQLKGYSPRTIESYVSIISKIALFYHTPADQLSIDQIREYILRRITVDHLSKPWVSMAISAIKILYCDVLRREWNRLDLPRPRMDKKVPVILSREEVGKIIQCKMNIKHQAILVVTYSAGLRLSEVSNLKITDIDSARMLIHLHNTKGGKERYTILSPIALDLLRTYYRQFKPQEWLFEGYRRDPISGRTVQHVFKAALAKSQIHKNVSIHSLRHSFATHLLEQGVALPLIQKMMGHKSLKTTSGYLHVQQYSIQEVKSPLDTLPI
jgi:site-specific recombinase XerD